MSLLSIELKSQTHTMNSLEQPAVDIDSFLHMGRPETENCSFARSVPSQFLPRLNKSQYTSMPFDIDHLVTLGKNTLDYRRSDLLTPTIEATTRESLIPGLLSNESTDSLSSEDSALTGVNFLPRTPSETSLSFSPFNISRPPSSTPIMDIDHLIQIGSNPTTPALNNSPPVVTRRTLDIDQYFDQAISPESNTCAPEIIEMDIDNLLSLSARHTFPMSSKSRQFLLKHYPLDIDNLIEIGKSSKPFLGELSSDSEKVDHPTKSTSHLNLRKRTSSSPAFRQSKSRFWVKCIGKLKKAFFV